ncbi:unnamed protein product, partial [Lymnaea stagnalis]
MKTPNPNQPKPTNRRLSRKRSHVSLDRLRRSMSLETCKLDSPGKNPVDAAVPERQTNSLKCRYNPPETIPEEEFERIRRESLIPRVGLLAGVGRRRSSASPPTDLSSCALALMNSAMTLTSPGSNSVVAQAAAA